MSEPHWVTYRNKGYATDYELGKETTTCTVCGFAGVDVLTAEPEQAVWSLVVTGSVYVIPSGTPVEGLSILDKDVLVQPGRGTGCPKCGSPNFWWAHEPGIRA